MAKKEIVETRCGIDFYLSKFNEKCSTRKEINLNKRVETISK
ncbi:hypothetical protein AP1_0383 [Aeromonas phage AP1]|nr:hypothetical protein AP1_0383 [Aeromonas phage AP1]